LEGHRILFPEKVFGGSRFGYRHLFQLFASRGFKEPDSFLPFGYDWRQPTSTSGEHLCETLQKIDGASDSNVVLIGHSMGCLVIRAALLNPVKGIAVSKVIELAPPHCGSSKAFRQLNQFPNVHPLIETVRGWFRNSWLDEAYAVLTRSLSGIWDLLPPDDEEILISNTAGNVLLALRKARCASRRPAT
jgi:hypothetical protein